MRKNARMHVAGNFHAASPSRGKPLSWHTDMRKSARESFDRFMSTRREQPRMLVSRSFPGNYGRIKHGTSSSIANKCCKRHTASAAVPRFFAFVVLRCVESFYAVFTNRAITNLSHVRLPDDTGQINATFFAIIRSSAPSLVELLPSAYSRRSSLTSGSTSPSVFRTSTNP